MAANYRGLKSRIALIALFVFVLLAAVVALSGVAWPGNATSAGAAAPCESVCLVPPLSPGILYVDWEATGANDGSSWDDAFVDLQLALDAALPGDEIWVAAGTYYPSVEHGGVGDRYKSFQMLNDVGIYGGFDPSVGDMAWEDRDWVGNEIVLSGDIGVGGDNSDNCYHVFSHLPDGNLTGSAILDGFTISDGNANGDGGGNARGGGMYNVDSAPMLANCTFEGNSAEEGGGMHNVRSSPALTNCTFSSNEAYDGGGMYNEESSPALTNCAFENNDAWWGGGGMHNNGSSPMLSHCTFRGNSVGLYGGGMYNEESSPTLTNCIFEGNSALYDLGGGMSNWYSSPTLTNCAFEGNSVGGGGWGAGRGGGMSNLESSPTLTNCIFEGNSAEAEGAYDGVGGGMHNTDGSSPMLTNCTFSGNSSKRGGGMWNGYSSPALTDCTFEGNSASEYGGGMFNTGSSPALTNCIFESNSASEDGGGMFNHMYSSSPALTNCTFAGNSAQYGGGMYNNDFSSPALTNCIFAGNSAQHAGGGMYMFESSPTLTNCTFAGNSAQYGGGMYNGGDWPIIPTVTNCILWGDYPDEIDGHGGWALTYSDIQGGYPGTGNIDADPLFVDPGSGDYHLGAGSPCIDTGTNDAPDLPQFDFEGDDRIIDGDGDGTATVDMGVDEYVLLGTMHAGGIEGYFSLDYLGRTRLRAHVYVEDQESNPLPDVNVFASIRVPDPCGGPHWRYRYTKPSGNARFHWGCNQSGTWTLCVVGLTRAGYVYAPGDNVVTCMDWDH